MFIERMLTEDVIEKKQAARGAAHRASRKKGFKGGMKTPYDYMSRKEQRLYTAPGEVTTYYLAKERKNEMITRETFDALNTDQKIQVIDDLRAEGLNQAQVAERLGYKTAAYYRMLKNINYPLNPQKGGRWSRKEKEVGKMSEPTPVITAQVPVMATMPATRFSINLGGVFEGKDFMDRVLGLTGVMKEDMEYIVNVSIVEAIKKDE